MESAEKATEGIMEDTPSESKLDRWLEKNFGPKMMTAVGIIGIVLSVVLALGLFLFLPTFLYDQIVLRLFGDIGWRAVIEGVIRVTLFVGYMLVISLLKDIRRVFAYHGAEHKTIYAYEAGLDLTVENVRAQNRLHPRCGTSFLFVVILLSILVSALLSVLAPQLWASPNLLIRMPMRLLMMPILMAVGYEFIRLAGKHLNNPITRALSFPGMSMQRITTKEPDDSMIQVGIVALKTALGMPCDDLWMTEEDDDATPSDEPSEENTDTL
jgi:uncharacterized protein YqhQ